MAPGESDDAPGRFQRKAIVDFRDNRLGGETVIGIVHDSIGWDPRSLHDPSSRYDAGLSLHVRAIRPVHLTSHHHVRVQDGMGSVVQDRQRADLTAPQRAQAFALSDPSRRPRIRAAPGPAAMAGTTPNSSPMRENRCLARFARNSASAPARFSPACCRLRLGPVLAERCDTRSSPGLPLRVTTMVSPLNAMPDRSSRTRNGRGLPPRPSVVP